MKAPWALRIDLALAVLRGRVYSISYFDGLYQVELPSAKLRRWKRRNDRRRIQEARKG